MFLDAVFLGEFLRYTFHGNPPMTHSREQHNPETHKQDVHITRQ